MGECPICYVDGATQLGPVKDRDATAFACPRCGRYAIDAFFNLSPAQEEKKHLLSAALRRSSDSGKPLTISRDDIDRLISSVPAPSSLFESIDRLLLLSAERAPDYWAQPGVDEAIDYPLIYARNKEEMEQLAGSAADLGYLEPDLGTITLEGWRRIEELRAAQPSGRQAFVAMSFAEELRAAWEQGLKPGIEASGYYSAIRVDSLEFNGKIDDKIVAEIRRSALLVADFTLQRAGVYFEAGLAQGLGIPVIWACRQDDVDNLHFDTRQYNHIIWPSVDLLRTRLDQRIRATLLPKS